MGRPGFGGGRLAGRIGINYLYRVSLPPAIPFPRRFIIPTLTLIVAWLSGTTVLQAQTLTAAADDSRFWLLIPEQDQPDIFTIYHHAYTDPPGELNAAKTLRGGVRPHGVAARGDALWIIYVDGTVQVIHAFATPLNDAWRYEYRVEPRLPKGVSVRDTALTRTGPWVLVRIEDTETLERIDAWAKPAGKTSRSDNARRRRNLAIGLPPGHGIEEQANDPQADQAPVPEDNSVDESPPADTDAVSDETTSEQPPVVDDVLKDEQAPAPASLPVDRLLTLRHGRWVTHPLPEDWPHSAKAWLVPGREQDGTPNLIAGQGQGNKPGRNTLTVYHDSADSPGQWSQTHYPLDAGAKAASLISVQGQLVLSEHHREQGELTATLSVLRDGKVWPVGGMTLNNVSPINWALLGTGNTAALIAEQLDASKADADTPSLPPLVWTRADMRGQTVLEPAELSVKMPSKMDEFVQYAMLGFVVILITVLMMAFWRRDSAWNRLDLPSDLIVADLPRRAGAAAIDLAPGLLGVMYYFDLNTTELLLRWPGNGIAQTAAQMVPGAIVIAIFVTHTTITEMILARTLGKVVTGLRTTTLAGDRPKTWQLLVRGLLKILDMLPGAWLLLMLPVIAPHRQRLGDLVGRTVVVCDAPPESDEDQDDLD